jgi:hypothetical protein
MAPRLSNQPYSDLGLTNELETLIHHNDVSGLHAKFSTCARPCKDTRAITEKDKVHCLAVAMPSASLAVISTLISHGAYLNWGAFRADIERGDKEPELLDLMSTWG